jgi:uncharacterized membrane protein
MNFRVCAAALALFALGSPAVGETDLSGLRAPVKCFGGEPFWGLTIHDDKRATYTWDNEPKEWKVRDVTHAMLRPTTWRVRFEGTNRQALIFDEGQQSCSDSDSDEPSAYGLLLLDGDAFFRGCCNAAPY